MNIKIAEKDKVRVNDPQDIYDIMQRVLLRDNKIDREKEHFWIVGINNADYIVNIELVSLGSSKSTFAEPMDVFRVALIKGAVKIFLVHNHPSGRVKPSAADKDLTDRLIQVGKIIAVIVKDHLIISPTTYLSFREIGLMDELEESIKYVPPYQLIEKIRNEEKAIRAEVEKELKGTRNALHKAVHRFLSQDMSSEEIAVILDIPVEEVMLISKRKGNK